ncbi:MAG: hypothetical protein KC493_15455 [Bacteriovoracaceae bacterium]|nr:hypothetical protein [Bacteriovoracaceae bacterium]
MALNIRKLMAPDHPEVTYPEDKLVSCMGEEGMVLDDQTKEGDVLLEDRRMHSLKHEEDESDLKKLDII